MKLTKIIHIDDDSLILGLAKVCLKKIEGIEIKSFSSAEEALPVTLEFKPDLVLLDLNLTPEKMSGIETLERIAQYPDIADTAVILMTGENNVQLPSGKNIIGLIQKPFQPQSLVNEVTALWKKKWSE